MEERIAATLPPPVLTGSGSTGRRSRHLPLSRFCEPSRNIATAAAPRGWGDDRGWGMGCPVVADYRNNYDRIDALTFTLF